jgi:endonuclease YncB( thermonuclease family)
MWRYVVLTCLLLPQWGIAETFFGWVTYVSDGDTLWVKPVDGRAPLKLRLRGLDAPEICQAGGIASRAALSRLVADQTVRVVVKYQDDYGRGLAQIWLGERDVAAIMVQSGHAWSSRWHRSLGPYAAQEAQARAARAGVFAEPAPELPRDFRQRMGSCFSARSTAVPPR